MGVGPWMKKPGAIILLVLTLMTTGYVWYRVGERPHGNEKLR